MTLILGFGSTEKDFVLNERKAIADYIATAFSKDSRGYFGDSLRDDVEAWVEKRSKAYKAADAKYRNSAKYPPRYSSYYATVLGDAAYLVVILNLFHTNRRHALSPDGWACLTERKTLTFSALEIEDATKARSASADGHEPGDDQ